MVEELSELFHKLKDHDGNTENGEDDACETVEGLMGGAVGDDGADTGEEQGKDHAVGKSGKPRHTRDGKVREGACQGGEGHNENACAHGGAKLVAENRGEDEKHHNAAACTHKATDKADAHARKDRAYDPLLLRNALHGFLGGGHGENEEAQTENKGHEGGGGTHGLVTHKACHHTADDGEDQNDRHHKAAVFDIYIFVSSVSKGADGTCQNVRGKGNAHGFIGGNV